MFGRIFSTRNLTLAFGVVMGGIVYKMFFKQFADRIIP